MSTADLGLIVSVFLAAAVEFVEALTIVLAMGVTRGWRSALTGAAPRWRLLAVVTVLAGYALASWLPEALLQLIVGTLLLIFGLQWLRKAILRSAGLKALQRRGRDLRGGAGGRARGRGRAPARAGLVRLRRVASRACSSKGWRSSSSCITFGLNADNVPAAAAGAALGRTRRGRPPGLLAHRPLARVPENTIKFAVGLLLSTFGTFWAVEGLGVFAEGSASLDWPGGDARAGRRARRLVRVRVGGRAAAAGARRPERCRSCASSTTS